MKRWFVTGTDTEVGKTYVACALIRHLVAEGRQVAPLKPVASGCALTAQGLRNDDALQLMAAANVSLSYEQVNPFAFEPAIAPHLAAAQCGRPVSLRPIAEQANRVTADVLVIEGAGGWCVPLGDSLMTSDLVRELQAKVLLVVGMRLGCINHALLTVRQIERDGLEVLGWVANQLKPVMSEYDNNLKTLDKHMKYPLLAEVSADGEWRPACGLLMDID